MSFRTGPHYTLRSLTLPGDINLDSHWLLNTKERQVSEHSVLPVADPLDRFSLQRDQRELFRVHFRYPYSLRKSSVQDIGF
jgi:hypothetical protein